MTEWHCEWQSNFPNTEKPFPKINDKQIKDRKADVLIKEHNLVLEFQHSKIDHEEDHSHIRYSHGPHGVLICRGSGQDSGGRQ